MPETEKMKLSTPWVTYYRYVYALFDDDPEVAVTFSDSEKVLKLYVENDIKAQALEKLLPSEKWFGNVAVKIQVIPSNDGDTTDALLRHAFSGNPILSRIVTAEGILSNPISYVAFEPSIIQFWNDDLSDLNGVCTVLPHEVAKNVFDDLDGVFFCTDLIDGAEDVE